MFLCNCTVKQGGIRVPTIMSWPDRVPGFIFESDYPVVTHDLLPTILEVLDVKSDNPDWELDGTSIIEVLETGGNITSSISRDPIGFTYAGSGISLAWMDMEWKLVENSNTCENDECDGALYNLYDDPFETNNLKSQYPDRYDSMHDDMWDWYRRVIKSQYHDSKCLIDRIVTYWEYVLIGVLAGLLLCCCCCFILIKCGCITGAGCVWAGSKVAEEIHEEVQMGINMDKHEKTKSEDELKANTGTTI